MNRNLTEKINTSLSLLALIVAAVALWFSYYTYRQGQEEKLAFLQKPILENYTTKAFQLGDKVVVPIYWELTISNNSAKTISLIDINAECKDSSGIIMYSRMFNGLYTEIDKQAELPVNLSSGESKKFVVSLGVLCDSLPSSIIRRELLGFNSFDTTNGSWTRLNVLKKLLSEHGIDFYGNRAEGTFDGEKLLTYEVKPEKQQTFAVKFITSNKQSFQQEFSLYQHNE